MPWLSGQSWLAEEFLTADRADGRGWEKSKTLIRVHPRHPRLELFSSPEEQKPREHLNLEQWVSRTPGQPFQRSARIFFLSKGPFN
jgi:hypothetical protein